MKIFKPKGFLAITYLIYAIFALLLGIITPIILIITSNKIYYLDICVLVFLKYLYYLLYINLFHLLAQK